MTDKAKLIGKHEFMSPIGKSNSFSSWQVSNNTKSFMELYYYPDGSGFIEWDIPEIEETGCIGLEFEFDEHGKRTLVGYDGVFAIPDQAMDLLEKHGVDCTQMRKDMAS